jgi:hypothetical protein
MWWWVALVLFIAVVLLFKTEDPRMTELKRRYYAFIKQVPEKYEVLKEPVVITGLTGQPRQIGSNVNKGSEIFICIDGDPNDRFHILLHELAHSTVNEYDHSDQFWKNFAELKDHAQMLRLYEPVQKKEYCGQTISDGP